MITCERTFLAASTDDAPGRYTMCARPATWWFHYEYGPTATVDGRSGKTPLCDSCRRMPDPDPDRRDIGNTAEPAWTAVMPVEHETKR